MTSSSGFDLDSVQQFIYLHRKEMLFLESDLDQVTRRG